MARQRVCNCSYTWKMFKTPYHLFDCRVRINARRRARLKRKRDAREAEATIGVGTGDGNLFVHGSYEAIKIVQVALDAAARHTRSGAPVGP
jgi:hypothetical protein